MILKRFRKRDKGTEMKVTLGIGYGALWTYKEVKQKRLCKGTARWKDCWRRSQVGSGRWKGRGGEVRGTDRDTTENDQSKETGVRELQSCYNAGSIWDTLRWRGEAAETSRSGRRQHRTPGVCWPVTHQHHPAASWVGTNSLRPEVTARTPRLFSRPWGPWSREYVLNRAEVHKGMPLECLGED